MITNLKEQSNVREIHYLLLLRETKDTMHGTLKVCHHGTLPPPSVDFCKEN